MYVALSTPQVFAVPSQVQSEKLLSFCCMDWRVMSSFPKDVGEKLTRTGLLATSKRPSPQLSIMYFKPVSGSTHFSPLSRTWTGFNLSGVSLHSEVIPPLSQTPDKSSSNRISVLLYSAVTCQPCEKLSVRPMIPVGK